MGTSSVRQRSGSKKYGGAGGSDPLINHLNKKPENSAEIFDAVMRALLPFLPDGSVKTPIYCAASELIRFAYAIEDQGLERAMVSTGVRITKEYIIPQIANATWNQVEAHLVKNNLEFPMNKYAEMAFKRTFIEVMERGVDAIAEQSGYDKKKPT